jgi:hypothetical protein
MNQLSPKAAIDQDARYGDLEDRIHDVREMAQVVAALAEHVEAGNVAWGPVLFAIYHLAALTRDLHDQYHDDGVANAG